MKDVDDKTLIVGVGDWLDSIIVPDKRYRKQFDANETEAIIDEEIDTLYDVMKPHAKQIIGIGDGNHEDNILKLCGTNPIRRLCSKLSTKEHEIPYLGYSWLLQVVFYMDKNNRMEQTRRLIIRGHHGWGGGSRTEGADITKYSHDVKFWQADVFLYGHVHKLRFHDLEEGRMIGDKRWVTFQKKMIVCGTYQRTYSNGPEATWAETRGFPPTTIKHPVAFLKPTDNGIEVRVQH
jgi:hypothetical protein